MDFFAYFYDEITNKMVSYKLIQGFNISEEYNETLDSATIKISDCPQINFNPYDDVFICSEYCGIYDVNSGKIVPNYNKKFVFKGYPVDQTNYLNDEMPYFYKHFLIDQFNEEIIILGDHNVSSRYKYTIQLFSETKGLETVQAPNISITQPLGNKISTVTYINRFLELYNKNIKVINSGDELSTWVSKKKYRLATSADDIVYVNNNQGSYSNNGLLEYVEDVFQNSYCPDFTLNNPSLRQILEKLFITKDRIPVVKDDKIYAMDITARRENFNLNLGKINYITGSKSSDNFCTDLKRTYSDALTQENSTRYVEYLGFRTETSGLMTLENMRIETRFPIYKINKIHMCYFKKITYTYLKGNEYKTEKKYFLCKQDITPLVKLNSERNVLSEDADEFAALNEINTNINKLAEYKLATVGYDIGSRYIDGWGTKYSRPTHNFFWQTETNTYIENMFKWMDKKYPYGIYNIDYLVKKLNIQNANSEFIFCEKGDINVIETENVSNQILNLIDSADLPDFNSAYKLKHLFFQIDYQGFYNGTIVHSKGLGKDNLTINDNPSDSLSLLELDGLAQKEKLARYGNKGLEINARYVNVGDVQSLGSVYEHDNDTDIVIFHKSYSVNANVVNCVYYGSKDYVLKNYFTSVYARHRTYNLMSYAESISRAENQKVYLLLSKNKKYVDNDVIVNYNSFDTNSFYKSFFSFFKETEYEAKDRVDTSEKINYAYFFKGNSRYATDLNMFTSGNSLCLNIAMNDNITLGTKISKIASDYKIFTFNKEQYVGSTQKWVWLADDTTTGQIKKLGFAFGHVLKGNDGYIDENKIYSENNFYISDIYNKIYNLPQIISLNDLLVKNQISFEKNIYKDNKERIDMTLQFEPIVNDDIYISPWLSKLSDLYGVYNKFNSNKTYEWEIQEASDVNYLCAKDIVGSGGSLNNGWDYRAFILALRKETIDSLKDEIQKQINNSDEFLSVININKDYYGPKLKMVFGNESDSSLKIVYYEMQPLKIKYIYFDSNLDITGISIQASVKTWLNESPTYSEAESEIMFNKTARPVNINDLPSYNDIKAEFFNYTNFSDDDYELFMSYTVNASDLYVNSLKDNFHCNASLTGNSFGQPLQFTIGGIEINIVNKNQNMYYFYITNSDYEFKDYMVSDQYASIPDDFIQFNYFGDVNVGSVIKFEWLDDNGHLRVYYYNRDSFNNHTPIENIKYVLAYYKDESGKFNFVFGFKVNENTTSTDIYISSISFKDLSVYDKDSNLKLGNVPIDESSSVLSYTLTYVSDVGFNVFNVERISSQNPMARIGVLSSGDVIFLDDVLKINYEVNNNYELAQEISSSLISVTGDVSLEYHTKLKIYEFSYNISSGNYIYYQRISVNNPTGYETDNSNLMGTSYSSGSGIGTKQVYAGDIVNYYSSQESPVNYHSVIMDSDEDVVWDAAWGGAHRLTYSHDVGFNSLEIIRNNQVLESGSLIEDDDVLTITYTIKPGYELYNNSLPTSGSTITVNASINLVGKSRLTRCQFSYSVEDATLIMKRVGNYELTGNENTTDIIPTNYVSETLRGTLYVYYGDSVNYYSDIEGSSNVHTISNITSFKEIQYELSSQEQLYVVGSSNSYIENRGVVTYSGNDLSNYEGKTIYINLNSSDAENNKQIVLSSYRNDSYHANSTVLWGAIEPENEGDTEYLYVSAYLVYDEIHDITSLKIRTYSNTTGSASNNSSAYTANVKAYVYVDIYNWTIIG